tara:strand:- start:158 stop:532 length:375 start_codon:yes stop_codon:yes gene_type:complete
MARTSIDDVTPREWDNLKNTNGRSDQEMLDALDTKMETDTFNHQIDNVNSPVHYNSGNVECIDAIEAMLSPQEFIGYLRGNSLKYRWRFLYKGKPIEDLKKADWYEQKLYNFFKENESVLGQKN